MPTPPNAFRHLVKDFEHDDSMGIRVFSNFEDPAIAEDNWGMDMEMPEWIQEVHNKFVGERCFIFGTGPSLIDQVPLLGDMNNEYTFTCNRMRSWEDLPFTPWVHCTTEPHPFLAWGLGVAERCDFPTAKNRIGCMWFPVRVKDWLWLPKAPDDLQVRWQGTFGLGDYLPPIPTAWASPLTISQLALWMGFSKIYLLGCDTTQLGQAWDRETGTTKVPRSIRSIIECAERIGRDVWRDGREIWDCSGGTLTKEGVLPYKDLASVIGEVANV